MSQEWLSKANAIIGYSNKMCVLGETVLHTHNSPLSCETKTSPVVLCPVYCPVLGKGHRQAICHWRR